MDTQVAGNIAAEQVDAVIADPSLIKGDRCAACHVVFALASKMNMNEGERAGEYAPKSLFCAMSLWAYGFYYYASEC